MLANIRQHSFMVARVAKTLVQGLVRSCATPPDLHEVVAGALLHDIAKTQCLRNNGHHAREGQLICETLGYPHLGEIVLEHVVLKNFNEKLYLQGIFCAKELVYYADKRVRHDEVVSLDERLAYIIERYGDGSAEKETLIRHNFDATLNLEQLLFHHLDFTPDLLSQNLADDFQTDC